jgi:hypothetical protein
VLASAFVQKRQKDRPVVCTHVDRITGISDLQLLEQRVFRQVGERGQVIHVTLRQWGGRCCASDQEARVAESAL